MPEGSRGRFSLKVKFPLDGWGSLFRVKELPQVTPEGQTHLHALLQASCYGDRDKAGPPTRVSEERRPPTVLGDPSLSVSTASRSIPGGGGLPPGSAQQNHNELLFVSGLQCGIF